MLLGIGEKVQIKKIKIILNSEQVNQKLARRKLKSREAGIQAVIRTRPKRPCQNRKHNQVHKSNDHLKLLAKRLLSNAQVSFFVIRPFFIGT